MRISIDRFESKTESEFINYGPEFVQVSDLDGAAFLTLSASVFDQTTNSELSDLLRADTREVTR